MKERQKRTSNGTTGGLKCKFSVLLRQLPYSCSASFLNGLGRGGDL